MGQTTILTSGKTAATSSDVSVPAGKSVILALSGSLLAGAEATVHLAGAADAQFDTLTRDVAAKRFDNPTETDIVLRVKRKATTKAFAIISIS